MSADFAFVETQKNFKEAILKCFLGNKTENYELFFTMYQNASGTDADRRTASDQAMKNLISELIIETVENKRLDSDIARDALKVITSSVAAAKQGICSASLPFVLLGDVLDCLTLENCDKIFCYIEEGVATWKSPQFYTAGKNYLLRMCNDLLRRLSQAQNTVFCGRIQLFLARLFPLSEKSALNLVSQFNSDNITIFNEKASESILAKTSKQIVQKRPASVQIDTKPQKDEIWLDGSEAMEVDQPEISNGDDVKSGDKKTLVDYELYHSIWSLQDVFRSPVQCYTKESWEKFVKNSDAVFRVFSSFKLDKENFSDKHNKAYFAKFLTSEKLTDLQLNDSMFRRQILCQFLILFQYLQGTVKFKSNNYVLSESQSTWIKSARDTVSTLMEDTPPDGRCFASYIKHLLGREEFWIKWKNEGCTSFIKLPKKEEEDKKPEKSPPAKKRKLTETNVARGKKSKIAEDFISGKPLGMGSPELTRLWQLCPDNLASCKSQKRRFLPTLENFFADSIELMDPKNMVEEEYMPYNDPNFQWKALRLLSQRSPLFFASQPALQQFKVVPQYLKGVLEKLSKEFPVQPLEQTSLIIPNGDLDKELDEEVRGIQEENEKIDEKEENNVNLEEDEENDDEVLEDDEIENEDALLNDDSQQEGDDIDSDEDNLLDPVILGDSLSSDEVTAVAQKIAADWEKLAPFLSLTPKDIAEIKEDSEDVILQARQTLVTWQDRLRQDARRPALVKALTEAKMENLIKEIS